MKTKGLQLLSILLCGSMLVCSCTACGAKKSTAASQSQQEAESEASESQKLANPWEEVSAERLCETIGAEMGVPKKAEDVTYYVDESDGIGEMLFQYEGAELTARISFTSAYEDISGLAYDDWEEKEIEVGRCTATYRETSEGDEKIQSCLWYDTVPGLMYSLSASGEDTVDLQAIAEEVFVPMQDET